ncbi:hypothetical protein F8S13_18360 [Chloroflexia bacterium SDU3-3]|nr:hypothetical protein F8S13_18360 [Chloroflexia bacterium SDU3-3]
MLGQAEADEWPRLIALAAETWAASTNARHPDRELRLAAHLIAHHPELGMALAEAFPWAEAQLRRLLHTQKF